MYSFELLKALAPFVGALCIDNFLHKQGDFCNVRQNSSAVLKYTNRDSEKSCYKDGIFYPRCKDLENPEVLYYHNLLLKGNS